MHFLVAFVILQNLQLLLKLFFSQHTFATVFALFTSRAFIDSLAIV